MTINSLYSKLYGGDIVQIECDKSTYETIRTGLIKKHGTSASMLSGIGDSSLLDTYVSASYDKATHVATFETKFVSEKKRKALNYRLL